MKAPARADGGGDDLDADPPLPDHPPVFRNQEFRSKNRALKTKGFVAA
jgi:hypothetical protein